MHTERIERLLSKLPHLLDDLEDLLLDIVPIEGSRHLFGCQDHVFAFFDATFELGFLATDLHVPQHLPRQKFFLFI